MRVAHEPAGSASMLEDLLQQDGLKVETIPEKKGILFLKHVEYRLASQHFTLPVTRRFSDFAAFHALLLQRFIYRMVPPLPPKRVLKGVWNHKSERHFIESRRRGLQRFMSLVMRHPILSGDELVKVFMTASSAEVQVKMQESFKRMGDEYITCPLSTIVNRFMPDDIQAQTETNREFICSMLSSFHKLRDVTERMSQRSRENSTDLIMFGKDLRALGKKAQPPQVASAAPSWQNHRQSIHGLSEEFRILADMAALQGEKEEDEVVERLSLFLDLLQSYKDLCDRHGSGVLLEHQRVQQRRPDSLIELLEQPESRLTQQENAILAMELRSYFSLFCLHQETQLVFTHLPLTTNILGAFIQSQIQGHKEMGEFWNELLPKLNTIFEGNPRISASPPRSPCRRIIFP
ncbi:sorting nexin-8 [Clupea harengus]|uniref:Sorting nexin-8 n=1 Tax=Clupea harengus TaxID=7950 RepID=A0A6P8F383_CLUHA|nr:sorting nexin-8 [Clupea harengus]XP_031418485.1 sorting nexin-8 [Clupea harengus]